MVDFWDKVKQAGSQDVILNRYERGMTVSRINRPDKGPFLDTDYFDVFGPTVLATNEIISEIAETRAIPIAMRKAEQEFDLPVTPEYALPLKEELTAWRFAHVQDNQWPSPQRIAKSRLGDIVAPLYQIILKVKPDLEEEFIKLVQEIEKVKLSEKSNSIDADILLAVSKVDQEVVNGVIASQLIANQYNKDKDDREKLTSRKIGNRLKSLSYQPTLTQTGALGFFWDEELLTKLLIEFGVGGVKTSKTSETPDSPRLEGEIEDIFK